MSARATYHEFGLDRVAQHFHLPEGSIVYSVLRTEEALAAVASGQVDVITAGGRPGMRQGGIGDRFDKTNILERLMPDFQFSYVVFGPSLLDGDPDRGVRLLRAYLKATKAYAAGETPAFLERYAKEFDLDYQQVKSACRRSSVPDGKIQESDLQALLDWSFKKSYVERQTTAKEMIDRRFLPEVRGPA